MAFGLAKPRDWHCGRVRLRPLHDAPPLRATSPFVVICRRIWRRRDGASAIEFALVAPVLIAIMFGMVIYGKVLANYIAVQELAAEAARATVAGVNNTERTTLATSFVTNNVASYPLLNPTSVTVTTNPQTNTFQVQVTYNMASDPILQLGGWVPLPGTTLVGSAVVQFSGY